MKILHTSDWHLGTSYEGVSREEDHNFFLKWLLKTIIKEQIDVLLIAGDIFDQMHPSSEAQKCYFKFLFQISHETKVKKVIILGGNHDSPSRLDAPAELLNLLDVFIVGGFSGDIQSIDRFLCPIMSSDNKVELVIAVVAFIHEFRLGVRTAFLSEKEIQQDFKTKFSELYTKLADAAEKIADGAPIMATGHMACIGSEKDDSPLEIHMVGTLGGLPYDIFDPRFCYIALGHIHRSYKIANSNAYYCGSPIPLCVKESKSARNILIVHIEKHNQSKPTVEKIEVPVLRNIVEISGELDDVYAQIKNLQWNTPLPPFLNIQIKVDSFEVGIDHQIRKQIEMYFSQQHITNIQYNNLQKNYFSKSIPIISSIKQVPILEEKSEKIDYHIKSLKDLTAEQVFVKMCELKNQTVDDNLLSAFRSLLSKENT